MMMPQFLKKIIRHALPPQMLNKLIDLFYMRNVSKNGLTIKQYDQYLDILGNNGSCIRISRKHKVYMADILNSFEYYFSAVEPLEVDDQRLVDYSTPRFHEVVGYELHPVMFPS